MDFARSAFCILYCFHGVICLLYGPCVKLYIIYQGSGGFDVNWNYGNLANWTKHFPICDDTRPSQRQSPININDKDVSYKASLQPLVLGNYHVALPDVKYQLKNYGSAVKVTITMNGTSAKSPIHIIHEQVGWRLVSFHFHWGSNNSLGSEHTMEGKQFPAEMHMIHYNTKYADAGVASKEEDGLLVWGHFFEVGTNKNLEMAKVIDNFHFVSREDQIKDIPTFAMLSLLPSDSVGNYYTYDGSLTTPGCFESVKWIVNKNHIVINQEQMDEFRKLYQSHNESDTTRILDNYRPTQPHNGRIVSKSFDTSAGVTVLGSMMNMIVPMFIGYVYNTY